MSEIVRRPPETAAVPPPPDDTDAPAPPPAKDRPKDGRDRAMEMSSPTDSSIAQ